MMKIISNISFIIVIIIYSYIFYQFLCLFQTSLSYINLNKNNEISNDATSGKLYKMTKIRNAPYISQNFSNYKTKKYAKCLSTKWAVTTSINNPTRAILQFLSFKNVCLVIIGDKKSPTNFTINSPNIIYLSIQKQKQLPYKIIEILPVNNFARKMIGYLFAIQHGAKQIYDFDDDNILIDNSDEKIFGNKNIDFIKSNQLLFNVYRFFQEKNEIFLWPRGYPLELIKEMQIYQKVDFENIQKVQVIQFLQNENPDLDAIYRLTQKIPKRFRSDYTQCIAINSFCPFNSQSTLFLYDSFPLLLLPMTVNGRVSDIWRSYILEAVFKVNGNYVSFCPSIVEHLRNPHFLMKDFNAEIPLYTQAKELIEFLKNNQIDKKIDIALKQIYNALYENNVLQIGDLELVNRWIFDLNTIGYKF